MGISVAPTSVFGFGRGRWLASSMDERSDIWRRDVAWNEFVHLLASPDRKRARTRMLDRFGDWPILSESSDFMGTKTPNHALQLTAGAASVPCWTISGPP